MTDSPKRLPLRFGALRGSRPVMTEHAQLVGRTQVASFARYADARRTVDLLALTHFPIHRVTVVGGNLKLVTDVDARITAWRAATLGGCGGLWIGALMVLIAVLDRARVDALLLGLSWGLPLGAVFGAALGLSAYAILSDPRGLPSRCHLVATRHELHVDAEIAASAWRLLLKLHPSGMTLIDHVPAEVIAQPTELVLIETFAPVEAVPEAAEEAPELAEVPPEPAEAAPELAGRTGAPTPPPAGQHAGQRGLTTPCRADDWTVTGIGAAMT
ncbi:hypothetical protein HC028_12990 [Planosporangium flavigriseum]|uniref:General stress protein 17M-like domain-containing protein n=1 Tax=Planosporangium flavigriseum TaxID=373681 RepID=A0A8J3PKD0_9ACTN|nr:general stress protein [Planosporangium flavigriseum]NJC65414.1 hypothetical protein [Planosporangium flavigriseum]GIG73231.1 hypothetical protein Pfl04_16350 [Planosporangium flavigriseum]